MLVASCTRAPPCLRRLPYVFRPSPSISPRFVTNLAKMPRKAALQRKHTNPDPKPLEGTEESPLPSEIGDPTIPPTIEPQEQIVLDPKCLTAIRMYNKRPPSGKLFFYHVPSSPMSCRNLKFVQTVHRNVQKHLAPLRFFLHVSEQLPSADLFRDLLYLSGGTSYNMFLDPKQQNKYHLPNATALVDLLAQDPVLLQVPLVRWTSTLGTKMLMGADAIPQLLEELERDRAKGIGIDNAQILHRLAHNSTSRFKQKLVAAKGPKVMKAIGLVAKLRTGEQI